MSFLVNFRSVAPFHLPRRKIPELEFEEIRIHAFGLKLSINSTHVIVRIKLLGKVFQ